MKYCSLLLMLIASILSFHICSAQTIWSQIGDNIDGEMPSNVSGWAISLSSDGSIVAIGAPWNNGVGVHPGHVRMFQYTGTDWVQLGSDIDGEAQYDESGRAVSLSSDGYTVAIGAHENDGNGAGSGHARIFRYNGTDWVQLGPDIDGESATDLSGWSVSLSSDGNTVAVGAINNDGINGVNSGHVRVFNYSGGMWNQMGGDIDGEAGDDRFGHSVSLSSDGNTVAAGAYGNDGNGVDAGHARVYHYSGGVWVQKGNDIDGENPGDYSGFALGLSSDGNTVAIGAYRNEGNNSYWAGHARVFNYSGGVWVQKGNDIDGEGSNDQSGYAVSISAGGDTVAIGAYLNDGSVMDAGHVRVYEYNTGNWTQVGNDIDGEASDDHFGNSVSLSDDGSTVAIGAMWSNNYKGYVGIFGFCGSLGSINVDACSSYISPSGNYIWTSSGTYYDTIPNSVGCDSIITINLTINNNTGDTVAVACDSFYWHGMTYTASATLTDTLTNSAGCDSVVTLSLTVNHSNSGVDTQHACDTFTWIDGITYTSGNNTATYFITNSAGCDSLVTLDLSMNYSTYGAESQIVCDSYISPSGNYTWENSGTYADTIVNINGCDSIITVDLIVNNSDIVDTNAVACDNFTWYGNTYTESGIYNYVLTNVYGCDSITILDLSVIEPPHVDLGNDITIFEDQTTIISGGTNLPNFLWSTGDTIPYIIVTGDSLGQGVYTYWLYSEGANGCYAIDTIIITVLPGLGIENIGKGSGVLLHPNPTTGELTIEGNDIEQIEIMNVNGQIILQQPVVNENIRNIVNLSERARGIYFIKVTTTKGVAVEKVVLE